MLSPKTIILRRESPTEKKEYRTFQSDRQALHWAACGGHAELASFLIEQGAEVDKPDDVRCFVMCNPIT